MKCLSQGYNDIMPGLGINPTTLQSLAWRSNQLNYTAAKNAWQKKGFWIANRPKRVMIFIWITSWPRTSSVIFVPS